MGLRLLRQKSAADSGAGKLQRRRVYFAGFDLNGKAGGIRGGITLWHQQLTGTTFGADSLGFFTCSHCDFMCAYQSAVVILECAEFEFTIPYRSFCAASGTRKSHYKAV